MTPFGFGMAGGGGGGGAAPSLSSMLKLSNMFYPADGVNGYYAPTKGDFGFESYPDYSKLVRNSLALDGTSTKYIIGGINGYFFSGASYITISFWVNIDSTTGTGARKLFAVGSTGSYIGINGTTLTGSFSCTDATKTFSISGAAPRDTWKWYNVVVAMISGYLTVGVFDESYYDTEIGGSPLFWGAVAGTGSLSFGNGNLALLGSGSVNTSIIGKIAGLSVGSDAIDPETYVGTLLYNSSSESLSLPRQYPCATGRDASIYQIPIYLPKLLESDTIVATSLSTVGSGIFKTDTIIDLSTANTDLVVSTSGTETGVTFTHDENGLTIETDVSAIGETSIYYKISNIIPTGVRLSVSLTVGENSYTTVAPYITSGTATVSIAGENTIVTTSLYSMGRDLYIEYPVGAGGSAISVNIKSITVSTYGVAISTNIILVDEVTDVLNVDPYALSGSGIVISGQDKYPADSRYYFDLADDFTIKAEVTYNYRGNLAYPDTRDELFTLMNDDGEGLCIFGTRIDTTDAIGVLLVTPTSTFVRAIEYTGKMDLTVRFNSDNTITAYADGVEVTTFAYSAESGSKSQLFVMDDMLIGSRDLTNSSAYSGAIGELKIYVGGVSDAQLLTI